MTPGTWEWTNPQFHTLIASPGTLNESSEGFARIEEAAGLLTGFESTRLVLDRLFELEVTPGLPNQFTVGSRPVLAPYEFREADVSDPRLAAIAEARNAVEAFDEKKEQ